MKHWTLLDKYNLIKSACKNENGVYETVGIHNLGLLRDIAGKLGIKCNQVWYLHSLWARITNIMRELIKAGYPIKELIIKSVSWSDKKTWHACFAWL